MSKLGGETPNRIRVWSCWSVTKTFHWKYDMKRHLVDTLAANCSGRETAVRRKRQSLGGQLPRARRWWTRRGRLDEKPSNDGMKTHNCKHKAPPGLLLMKTCATVKHYVGFDCLRTPRSRRQWTRMGNKVKREELGCLYHENNSRLLHSINCHNHIVL